MTPEFDIVKVLLGSAGGGGIAAIFAWLLFKAYTASVTKSLEIQEKRIDSVEARSKTCEEDRARLHEQMKQIQTTSLADTRDALTRSADVLERFATLAEQRGWSVLISDGKE